MNYLTIKPNVYILFYSNFNLKKEIIIPIMELDKSVNLFKDSFDQIIDNISLLKIQMTEVQQKIRQLEKNIKKELKNVDKINKINNMKKEKKPSGFATPRLVTSELCEFMDKPLGTAVARTDVNKYLISYIKNNNLQDIANKSVIIPDSKLKDLLGVTFEQDTPLTFFTIQKYMNKHFITNKNNDISQNSD